MDREDLTNTFAQMPNAVHVIFDNVLKSSKVFCHLGGRFCDLVLRLTKLELLHVQPYPYFRAEDVESWLRARSRMNVTSITQLTEPEVVISQTGSGNAGFIGCNFVPTSETLQYAAWRVQRWEKDE
jgi:hypothetical protein